MHYQNVRVVFNFAKTVHTRNKSHAKHKAFTVTHMFPYLLFLTDAMFIALCA